MVKKKGTIYFANTKTNNNIIFKLFLYLFFSLNGVKLGKASMVVIDFLVQC